MATAKKATKKPVVKRAPAKSSARTTVRRKPNPLSNVNSMRSFHASPAPEPFFTFRITHQTVYWSALAILVLLLGLWVININDRVQYIYDQVDLLNASSVTSPHSTPNTKQYSSPL